MTKRCLSLAGGGMRGVILAEFLACIERDSGKRIQDLFHLIAGTSTGSIAAACLSAPNPAPASELKKFYYESGSRIFKKVLGGWWNSGLWAPRYKGEALDRELQLCVGNYTLDQAVVPLLIPTYESTKRNAVFIKSWEEYWKSFPAWKAARCSSSAQTFFPPCQVGNLQYIDGGNFAAAPTTACSFEAFRLWPADSIRMLFIGTGKDDNPGPLPTGGGLSWAAQIFGAFTEGQDDMTEYMAQGLIEPGYAYRRLDIPLHRASLDDTSKKTLDRLCDLAKREWDRVGEDTLKAIINHE